MSKSTGCLRSVVMVACGILLAMSHARSAPAAGATAPPADRPAAASTGLSDQVGWMAGHWEGVVDGVQMTEVWLAPAGGLMLGMHRDVPPSGKAFFEFLRIEATPQGVAYLASPRGREATAFPLKEAMKQRVVFENLKHDFPQRIIYWLDAEGLLHARVEGGGAGGQRAEEWAWRRRAAP